MSDKVLEVGRSLDSDKVFVACSGDALETLRSPLSDKVMHAMVMTRAEMQWLICAMLTELSDPEADEDAFAEDVERLIGEAKCS